jgi:hypothetical protein
MVAGAPADTGMVALDESHNCKPLPCKITATTPFLAVVGGLAKSGADSPTIAKMQSGVFRNY